MFDSKEYKINNSSVRVIYGDLLSSDADAIVISGSVGLPMKGGLPQAVREKAGESVATDVSKHSDAKLGDVVFLSSENSNKSDNVAKEISIADKYGKVIIPVRLDTSPMNPKMDYDLAGIDFVELFSFEEKSLAKLRNAILGHLAMNNSK